VSDWYASAGVIDFWKIQLPPTLEYVFTTPRSPDERSRAPIIASEPDDATAIPKLLPVEGEASVTRCDVYELGLAATAPVASTTEGIAASANEMRGSRDTFDIGASSVAGSWRLRPVNDLNSCAYAQIVSTRRGA
jgi:hypothetical protein